jgi:hypothetical protein
VFSSLTVRTRQALTGFTFQSWNDLEIKALKIKKLEINELEINELS